MKKIVFIVVIILFIGIFYFFSLDKIGGDVIEKNSTFEVRKVKFNGDDNKEIYGLFFVPFKNHFDSVIVLPGAGGTKESRRKYAEFLLKGGYGSLIIDQRGIGETGGPMNSFEKDFYSYLKGEKVYQYIMARDVVNAVDFLDKIKKVDEIAVIGESMGGRFAMISGGIDNRIKSVIVVSSSGYFDISDNKKVKEFFDFINPNDYVKEISPRRLLMIHSKNDNIIPIEDARKTFEIAKEPKKFIELKEKECIHGYCKPIENYVLEELNETFKN